MLSQDRQEKNKQGLQKPTCTHTRPDKVTQWMMVFTLAGPLSAVRFSCLSLSPTDFGPAGSLAGLGRPGSIERHAMPCHAIHGELSQSMARRKVKARAQCATVRLTRLGHQADNERAMNLAWSGLVPLCQCCLVSVSSIEDENRYDT